MEEIVRNIVRYAALMSLITVGLIPLISWQL